MKTKLMLRLAGRSRFSRKFGVRYVEEKWPYLAVDDLRAIARITGEAAQEARKREWRHRVLLRGQTRHHEEIRPSLFRGSTVDYNALRSAEKTLACRIRRAIPVRRFERRDIGALLQHYGFRTSWLDAVDNAFVASWFAANRLTQDRQGKWKSRPSNDEAGWLYVLSAPADGIVDLRESHHPLSVRAHVQHGASIASVKCGPDLRHLVVATLRVPIIRITGGRLLEQANLFPPARFDHTLRLLLRHRADRLATGVEEEYGLPVGALGRTMRFS